ncbi:MAG: sugar ABC transporter permease [Clostridiales bacterium]|nr:sugar ABC transporter permease [Clostridiales bacterium]
MSTVNQALPHEDRKKSLWFRIKKHKLHLLMIVLPILQFIIFKWGPMYGVQIAFKNFKILKGIEGSPWVGFDNFTRLLTSYDFAQVFGNTLILAIYNFIFGFPAPILLALMLNELRGKKFKRVTQTLSYLPHFVSWVILTGIFMDVLSPSRGPIAAIFRAFGADPIYFLGNPKYFRGTLVVTGIWKGIGWGSIVYLSALGSVNEELYDAAHVDGCGRWGRIWHVTLPGITPTITIMMIMAVGNLVDDNFDQVFNLLNPAVYSVGDVLGTYIYRSGINNMDYSYSTAVDLFRNIISLILVVGANTVAKRVNEYGLW